MSNKTKTARFTIAATATGFCLRDARRPGKDIGGPCCSALIAGRPTARCFKDIGSFETRRDARVAAEHLTVATQG